jgi:hypothetical protein
MQRRAAPDVKTATMIGMPLDRTVGKGTQVALLRIADRKPPQRAAFVLIEETKAAKTQGVTTWEEVCDIVRSLPGTELDTGDAHPAWRVNGKVLVRRNPRLRVPAEDAIRGARGEVVAVRVDPEERESLVRDDPRTFFVTPHWEKSPSVLVWLDTVEIEQLRELIVHAWRTNAPKRLTGELAEG